MTAKKYLYIAILFNTIALNGICQKTSEISLEFIRKISVYRDSLLLSNPGATIELSLLFEKWKNFGTPKEEAIRLQNTIYHLIAMHNLTNEEIVNRIKTLMPDLTLATKCTTDDVQTIRKNNKLIDMINIGLLEPKSPFKLSADNDFIAEMNEYNLSSGDKIGEIGAGGGAFSLMAHSLFPGNKTYINDINKDLLQSLKKSIDYDESIKNIDNLELILGEVYSTNMEGYDLDKIILRNSFHHFFAKGTMLRSIKKSLIQNGELYILESIPELDKDGNICSYAMKKNKIIRKVESKGFQLVGQKQIGESILLKFIMKK
ncbi:MAG: methyltransferase domain-containing protein [Lewinellaceae bacterium]|nr:methyltransferase domain-containing protein [Lewinellaceae bacterium]